ncbi:MAG: hypothetical protein ACI9KE_005467 [Polyangiales bacterium]|jgi:hypothetical protein
MKRCSPLLSALLFAGCFGQPGSAAEDALGDVDHEPTGDEHRPGQPCLVCHGAEYTPGGDIFEVAGTIYDTIDAQTGIAGVDVIIEDADGQEIRLRSNRAGNFYLDEGDAAIRFPLHVAIERGGERMEMRSPILREGSCAHCHTKEGPNESSVGRVFLRDTP